jgi:hypothetical protein
MIHFLTTAFPEFRVRADETDADGSRWVHVGTDDTYIALSSTWEEGPRPFEPYSGLPGVNHLGFEVDNAAALLNRMLAAGYEESRPNRHPHRTRVYSSSPRTLGVRAAFSVDPASETTMTGGLVLVNMGLALEQLPT